MSVLISTCEEINKSCTNNSQSKQLWSFAKSKRFDSSHKLTSDIVLGDIYDYKSKYRGASIGYGKKYDYFTRNIKNKSDKFYTFKSDFDSSNNKKSVNPSYSFGKKINWLKQLDKNVKFNYNPDQPGPGTYDILNRKSSPKYSLGGRNILYSKKPEVPGSGAYNYDQIQTNGKYVMSKNASISQCVFGSNRSPRFGEIIKRNNILIIYFNIF
jgi:hypothetical protein